MRNVRKPEIELWYNYCKNTMRIIYINEPNKNQEYSLGQTLLWDDSVLKSSETKILKSFGYKKIGEL